MKSSHPFGNRRSKQQSFHCVLIRHHKQLESGLCVPNSEGCLSRMGGRRAWVVASPTATDHQGAMGLFPSLDFS